MRQSLLLESVLRSYPLDTFLDSTEEVPLPSEFDVDDFLDDWRDAFDSDEDFRERLEFTGHTVEDVREQFEQTPRSRPDEIPRVFETAEQVVDRTAEYDEDAVGELAARHEDAPFVDLLAPLVEAGREPVHLENDYGQSARESLTDWLFDRLRRVFQHPLFILFKAYQRTEYPETDFGDREDSTAVYDEFVAEYADYGGVFEAYPVLLKLLGVVVEQWRGAVRRMDDRIATDRADLARTFDDGTDLGRIADVETLSDDPHGDGEVVFGIHFENDCSVVYKPRSVGSEAAFDEILDWTNDRASVPDLYAPTVLDRGEYGWMEFVGHRECDSASEVERYYERMGALSALAFVLGSTDLHHDNIVAMGEHPVIVDQEMALSPRFENPSAPSSPALSSLVEDSILDTVLIPFTSSLEDEDAEVITNSGLAKLDDVEDGQKTPTFVRPNADAMELTFRGTYSPDATNLPRLDGGVQKVSSYLDELKRGFCEVVDAIRARRDEFLAPDGPLDAFEGCEIRYLLRPTGHYKSKLTESVYSSQLRSGLRRSLALEALYRIFVSADDDDDLRELVSTEKETLRRFTVPRFTVAATGRELRDGRGQPQDVFADQSPLVHARERVANLDEHWTETQLQLIDLAFTDSKVPGPVSPPSSERRGSVVDTDAPRAVVSSVVERLAATTTEYPDGSLRWAELARLSPNDAFLVQEPELHLYEGYAGVGLFLAAVAAVRDDDELADRTRRVLKPVELAFEDGDASHLDIGGIIGRGSVAYGLVTAGELLDDPDLVETARDVTRRTTREEIETDDDLDVVGGAAGELLAQLAVHERTGDDAALDRAQWCGDRLLDAATETPEGYRIPTTEEADRRFAFAHGVGGIGYALVELGSVLDEEAYAQVGWDALRLELDLWRRENDADEASAGTDSQIWGWCNGAAGVGTCWVAAAERATGEPAEVVADLRDDLRTENSLEASLCCGSAGRALFMLDAGETFDDPELVDSGEQLFANVLERAEREGRIPLGNHLPMLPRFGLFTGLAGVGYLALQFEAREAGVELPNVTRLE